VFLCEMLSSTLPFHIATEIFLYYCSRIFYFLCYSFLCMFATKMLGRISNFFTKEQGFAFPCRIAEIMYTTYNVILTTIFKYGFQNGSMICIVHIIRDLVLGRKWVNRNKLKKETCIMSFVKKKFMHRLFSCVVKNMNFSKVHTTWEIGNFMLVLHKCVKMKPLIRLRLIWTKEPIKKHVRNHAHHLIQPSQKRKYIVIWIHGRCFTYLKLVHCNLHIHIGI